jgi:hypothetical protein
MPKRSKNLATSSTIVQKTKSHESAWTKWFRWAASLVLLVLVFSATAYSTKRMILVWLGRNCDYKKIKMNYSVDGIQAEWGYSGWGFATNFLMENRSELPAEDKTIYGEVLNINGVTFLHGLSVHAPSQIAFALNGKISHFSCLVGFDQISNPALSQKAIFCSLLSDGREIFKSRKIFITSNPVAIDVSVLGVKELILRADITDLEDSDSNVDWVNLGFKP